MDLSASRRRLTPEERSKRMAEGRCYCCGGIGHLVRECPLATQTPVRIAGTTTVISVPTITTGLPMEANSGQDLN